MTGSGLLAELVRGSVKANLIHHLAHTGGLRTLRRIGRAYRPTRDWLPPGMEKRALGSTPPPAFESVLGEPLRREAGNAASLALRGTFRVFSTPTLELTPDHPGLEDLRAARALRPDLLWAKVGLGLSCLRLWQGDSHFKAALECFGEAVALHPRWAWGYLLRSEARRVLIDYDGALADLSASLRLDPELAWAYAFRARILFQRATDSAGLKEMDRAIALENAGWMRAWRGEAYRRLGRPAEARRDFDAAVKLDPLYDQAYVWRAKLLTEGGKPRAALASLDKGIRLCPAFEKAYRQRIRVLRDLGRTEEALRTLADAARLNHRNNWLGTWRVEGVPATKESEAALAELDALLRRRPRHFWARAWRGETLSQLRRPAEGLRDLEAVAAVRPEAAWVLCWRGECLLQSGRARDALPSLDRAVALDPSYGRAWVWRARARAALGDWAGAEKDLVYAVNARRIEYSWIYGWRGEARLKLGRYAEAASDYAAALQLDSRRPEFVAGLTVARRLAAVPAAAA